MRRNLLRTPAVGVTSSASLALAVDRLSRSYRVRIDADHGGGAGLSRGTPNASILLHSVGNRPQDSEVDVGLVYADYYFIEALLRRRGLFLE